MSGGSYSLEWKWEIKSIKNSFYASEEEGRIRQRELRFTSTFQRLQIPAINLSPPRDPKGQLAMGGCRGSDLSAIKRDIANNTSEGIGEEPFVAKSWERRI